MNKGNTIFIGENKSFWERNRRSGGYLMKRRSKEIAVSVIRALLMFGLCFMIIQPMLTRFSMSFMEERDLYDSTIILLPRHVTLENYTIVADLTSRDPAELRGRSCPDQFPGIHVEYALDFHHYVDLPGRFHDAGGLRVRPV